MYFATKLRLNTVHRFFFCWNTIILIFRIENMCIHSTIFKFKTVTTEGKSTQKYLCFILEQTLQSPQLRNLVFQLIGHSFYMVANPIGWNMCEIEVTTFPCQLSQYKTFVLHCSLNIIKYLIIEWKIG